MEQLIIVVIWVIGSAIINANKKNKGKTNKGTTKQKRKNVLSSFMEEVEKEIQSEKQIQRLERPRRFVQPTKPAQPSMMSELPKSKSPSKPEAPPKPVGLEIDAIGGDEEIGGIKEVAYKESNNNINLDLKNNILKGIIYSEILSKPKSLRK